MTNNMYRVGDYVYVETSSATPYQIRRIEELVKTPQGNVEAKVMCFFRRRDIPSHLLAVADLKHNSALDEDGDPDDVDPTLALTNNHHSNASATTTHLHNSPHSRLLSGPTQQQSSNSRPSSTSNSSSDHNNSSSSPPPSTTIAAEDRLSNNSGNTTTTTTSAGSSTATNATTTTTTTTAAAPAPSIAATTTAVSKKSSVGGDEKSGLTEDELHQLRHRELFLTRQVETQPATHIRGKCTVTLLNETETLASYIAKEDTFFYSLVYDPQAKTLLADKGEIRIGSKYQAEVTPLLKDGETDGRSMTDLEDLVWTPQHGLTDRQIDQFLVVARSVGTFARALDCSSSVKQPSLHMSAAAASRDITLLEAMSLLHSTNYDLSQALSCLVPPTGPLLCRDQMEEWAASEANLFEEALEKYGKDFNDLRQDFLPWKTLKNIIEYYYMWKTTDRYVQQKRVKAVEAESKLKQVFIPNYNKPNPAAISNCNGKGLVNGSSTNGGPQGNVCEGCAGTVSSQWYAWGAAQKQGRLCQDCWVYWKKLGGLKKASRSAREDDGSYPSGGSAASAADGSSSNAAPHQHLLKRRPHQETNGTEGPPAKRAKECIDPPLDPYRLSQLGVNPPPGLTVTPIGMNGGGTPPPSINSSTPSSTHLVNATPPPPPYHSTHHTTTTSSSNATTPVSGVDGTSARAPPPASSTAPQNLSQLQHAGGGRTKLATMSRLSGRPRIISWMDAPDDVYFYSTATIRSQRRTLTSTELKRAARRPWRRLLQLPHTSQQPGPQQQLTVASVVAAASVAAVTSQHTSGGHLTAAD